MKQLKYLLIIFLIGSIVACSNQKPPLRVGLLAWPPYELVYIAQKLGYYETDRIEIVEFQSPAEAWRAYAVGSLDIVALTLNYALELSHRGSDDRVILIIDESFGGDAVISQLPLDNLAQLRGMRIGLEPGPLGSHMLRRLLDKAGLSYDEVSLAYFDIPDQEAAYTINQVDAMVTYEPVRTSLLKLGGSEIFSSRDIPGEIIDVFIARDSLVNQRLDDFRHFSHGWFQALEYLQQQPAASAQLMASRLNMSGKEVLQALDGVHIPSLIENQAMLTGNNLQASAGIKRFVITLRQRGSTIPDTFMSMFTTKVLPLAGEN